MKAMGKRSVSSLLTILLNVARGVVALALALTVLVLVLAPLVKEPLEVDAWWLGVGSTMTIPVSFTVDSRAHRIGAPSLGITGAELTDVRGSLKFPARQNAFLIGSGVLLLVMLALAWWVLGQLRALFQTLREGQPFVPANARRLRRIAVAIIAGELARAAIVYFENYYAMTYFTADGMRFDAPPDLNLFAIVDGLIVLVIAEVFRAGTRLDQEQSLTI
jgi:hypothetical protein